MNKTISSNPILPSRKGFTLTKKTAKETLKSQTEDAPKTSEEDSPSKQQTARDAPSNPHINMTLQERIVQLQHQSKKISKNTLPVNAPINRYRRTWHRQEDKKILELIQEHGQNWTLISKIIGGSRTGKQIRDRYLNKLDPNIVNKAWTPQQDSYLFLLYTIYGRKWAQIAKLLPGRTEAMVKNRFSSKFKQFLINDQIKPLSDQMNANNPLMDIESLNQLFGTKEQRDNASGQLIFKDLSLESLKEIALNKMKALGLDKPQDINRLNINIESLFKLHSQQAEEPGIHNNDKILDQSGSTNNLPRVKIENVENQNPEFKIEFEANDGKLVQNKSASVEEKIAQIEKNLGSENLVKDWINSVRSIVNKRKTQGKDPKALKSECTSIAQNILEEVKNLQQSFSHVVGDMNNVIEELKKRVEN